MIIVCNGLWLSLLTVYDHVSNGLCFTRSQDNVLLSHALQLFLTNSLSFLDLSQCHTHWRWLSSVTSLSQHITAHYQCTLNHCISILVLIYTDTRYHCALQTVTALFRPFVNPGNFCVCTKIEFFVFLWKTYWKLKKIKCALTSHHMLFAWKVRSWGIL